ncbi:Dedicator of cytokinesi protein 8 [Taenia solium]|eukprot:TsM_001125100 transcript=TsM_001125100 gene=TsM_001125100
MFAPINVLEASFHEDDINFQQYSGGEFTDFSKESFLTRLSDVAAKVKNKGYFAQKVAECGSVTKLAVPNAIKYISHYRLAPQGVDWPECVCNENIIRQPLFVLLQANEFLSKVEAASAPLFTVVYLFDAILDCRLSEAFNLGAKMTGVLRVTDRWRELSKILLANEDHHRNTGSTTSLRKEVGSYLKGVYLIIEVSKRLPTQGSTAKTADLIPTGLKPIGTSTVSNTKTDDALEGDSLLTPFAWTAVDLSAVCFNTLEGQNQRMAEALRRPRLLSDASDALKRSPRSRTISNDRRFSVYALGSSSNDLQVCELINRGLNLLPLEDSSPPWGLSTNDLSDSSKFVELSFQLTTRNFIKKDLTTGNHSSEVKRTIMEAFKLQSSTPNMSPWVHDIPTRVGHGHPLRRLKTFSGQMEVSMTGRIVSSCGLARHFQSANFCSAEGESLLTRGHSETELQEVVEFPTIGRVFPFNSPRNLLYIYPQSATFGTSKSVSKNIEIVIQLWCSDTSGRHTILAFPDGSGLSLLKNKARTHVIPKNRSPEFTDEIKVVLPKDLNSGHHLLFTFVHVELSSSRDTNESVLGYSDDMETGKTYALDKTSFHLRVVPVSSLYQDDDFVASIIRSCDFENVSETIESLNERDIFLIQSDSVPLSSPPPLLLYLQKAKLNQLVLHLAPIMDGLLRTLGVCLLQNKAKQSQNLLALLAFYIHRISKGLSGWKEEFTGRNHFICAYLSGIGGCSIDHVLPYLLSGYPMLGLAWVDDVHEYLHRSVGKVTKKLHEELLQCLIAQIAADTPFFRNFYEETLWFFLELLVRTLIVECAINAEPVSDLFLRNLGSLTREVTKSISTRLKLDDKGEALDSTRLVNCAFAFFLQDLLTSLNATHVFRFISTYMQTINSIIDELLASSNQDSEDELAASSQTKRIRNLGLLKLEMLQIVTASPDYLILSLPDPKLLPDSVHPINQAAYFIASKRENGILTDPTYQRLHFLQAMLLGEIQTCLLHSDPLLQTNALTTLWYLMKSHESQPFVWGAERESLSFCDAAALYIPLLDIACDHASVMYASWIIALEKQERVFREVAKVSMLLDAQRSANDGASKRSGWILSSITAKERVKWMGRRISLTPDHRGSVEHRPSSALPIQSHQECTTFSTSMKTWIHALLPPAPSLMPSETMCAFNDCVTRLLLLEMLWILHYTDQQVLQRWLDTGSVEKARNLVDLLILALNYFEYPSGNEYLTGSVDDCPKGL